MKKLPAFILLAITFFQIGIGKTEAAITALIENVAVGASADAIDGRLIVKLLNDGDAVPVRGFEVELMLGPRAIFTGISRPTENDLFNGLVGDLNSRLNDRNAEAAILFIGSDALLELGNSLASFDFRIPGGLGFGESIPVEIAFFDLAVESGRAVPPLAVQSGMITAVPEPTSFALVGGIALLFTKRHRRQCRKIRSSRC